MNLAPSPILYGHVVAMSKGFAGVQQTIAKMRQLVQQSRVNAAIRQAATNAIFLTPEKDQFSEVEAVFNYVRDHIRYTRDVLDVETLSTPEITLATRLGDCDDQSTLLAALLESVGYQTRFVIEGYQAPGHFDHVYLQCLVNGEWIAMDATESHCMGWSPANVVTQAIENV